METIPDVVNEIIMKTKYLQKTPTDFLKISIEFINLDFVDHNQKGTPIWIISRHQI